MHFSAGLKDNTPRAFGEWQYELRDVERTKVHNLHLVKTNMTEMRIGRIQGTSCHILPVWLEFILESEHH